MAFSFRRFCTLFLKVGNLTFGGGDPTMAVFHQELVVLRRWVSPENYSLIFSLARTTPGTNLLAFCAGIGWLLAHWRGALAAVLAVSTPCAFAVVWFTVAYDASQSNRWAMAAVGGTLAAAVGMMAGGAYHLVRAQWKSRFPPRTIAIFAGSLALSLGLGMSPIQVIALGALTGLVWRPSPAS